MLPQELASCENYKKNAKYKEKLKSPLPSSQFNFEFISLVSIDKTLIVFGCYGTYKNADTDDE